MDTAATQQQQKTADPQTLQRAEWIRRKEAVKLNEGGIPQAQNAQELSTLCEMYAKSGIVPSCYQGKPADIFVAIQMARALGVPDVMFLQKSFVHKGVPAPYAAVLLAVCQRSPLWVASEYRLWTTGKAYEDDYTWHCRGCRAGGQPMEFEFSVARAKRAGLWERKSKSGEPMPWSQYPDDMGYWKAIARMCKKVFADLTYGIVSAEEIAEEAAKERLLSCLDLNATTAQIEDQLLQPNEETVDVGPPTQPPASEKNTNAEPPPVGDDCNDPLAPAELFNQAAKMSGCEG